MSDLPHSPRKQSDKVQLNPVKTDPTLKALLVESQNIESTAEFNRWKRSFLNRLEEIIQSDPQGKQKAIASYELFSQHMNTFSETVVRLQTCLASGAISAAKIGVKGRNALNEVNRGATAMMMELQKWMPTVRKEEIELGYTKWQLGAVLVQNGFAVYSTMIMCRDMLKRAVDQECLKVVADRQTLDAIEYYERQITRFCDVMADLGLYELMVDSNNLRSHEYKMGMSLDSLSIDNEKLWQESAEFLDLTELEDDNDSAAENKEDDEDAASGLKEKKSGQRVVSVDATPDTFLQNRHAKNHADVPALKKKQALKKEESLKVVAQKSKAKTFRNKEKPIEDENHKNGNEKTSKKSNKDKSDTMKISVKVEKEKEFEKGTKKLDQGNADAGKIENRASAVDKTIVKKKRQLTDKSEDRVLDSCPADVKQESTDKVGAMSPRGGNTADHGEEDDDDGSENSGSSVTVNTEDGDDLLENMGLVEEKKEHVGGNGSNAPNIGRDEDDTRNGHHSARSASGELDKVEGDESDDKSGVGCGDAPAVDAAEKEDDDDASDCSDSSATVETTDGNDLLENAESESCGIVNGDKTPDNDLKRENTLASGGGDGPDTHISSEKEEGKVGGGDSPDTLIISDEGEKNDGDASENSGSSVTVATEDGDDLLDKAEEQIESDDEKAQESEDGGAGGGEGDKAPRPNVQHDQDGGDGGGDDRGGRPSDDSDEAAPSDTPKENTSKHGGGGGGGGGSNKKRPHLRLQLGSPFLSVYNRPLKHDDCVLVPDLFGPQEDMANYDALEKEIKNTDWRPSLPKSAEVISKVMEYFDMDPDSLVSQSFHYPDGSSVSNHNAKTTSPLSSFSFDPSLHNIAVRLYFGTDSRELCLEDTTTDVVVHIPHANNSVCALGRDVNVRYDHSEWVVPVHGECLYVILLGRARNATEC